MTMQQIIVGFDGSSSSNQALDAAIDLAKRYECGVQLVHVIDWSPYEFRTWDQNEIQERVKREQIQSDREALFPDALQKLADAGLTAEAHVKYGHPAAVLSDMAAEQNAAFIVVGKRGQSKLKRVLLGSVASSVIQEADCPVMVVPATG